MNGMPEPQLSFSPDAVTTASYHSERALVDAPARMMWVFQPKTGLDAPFHDLISAFGGELIMALDDIVLDSPKQAAIRATKIFQEFSSRVGRQNEVRDVMQHIAIGIKSAPELDSDALMPEQSVFKGFSRPRG